MLALYLTINIIWINIFSI